MAFHEAQLQAIHHREGPMMVLAGPGSGKTEVIIRRTRKLIQDYQVAPSSILVVTFTKAAAGQMRERFLHLCGAEKSQVTFGTSMESFTVFSGRRTVSHRQISPVKK